MEIQFSTEVLLPSMIKQHLQQDATRFLAKHQKQFNNVQLEMHLRYEGPQVECQARLITNDGRYHADVLGWDVRQIVHQTFENIDLQVNKHLEKREDSAHYDRTTIVA